MRRRNVGGLWAGMTLIGLGVVLLVAWQFGWDRLWPIFPLFAGVAFWAGYFVGGMRDWGLTWIGTVALLLGIFFFGFTTGRWEWAQMAQLWPVFPLIAGVAWIVQFAASRARDVGALGIGLVALAAGIVGLGYTQNLIQGNIIRFWPLLIVLGGVVILAAGLFRASRRS